MDPLKNFPERASLTSQEIRSSAKEIIGSVRELISSLTEVTRNEVALFKKEVQHEREVLTKNAIFLGIAGAFAMLAMLAFVSFCIIGLGGLMNGNYWASSLIVFGVLAILATVVGSYAYSRLVRVSHHLGAPLTTHSLKQEAAALESRVRDISEAVKRRTG